jgi:hypothetical protein
MNRFEFNLATRADDQRLRTLLAATPMDGCISWAFAREPSFFSAAEVEGDTADVGVVRDRDSGRIVGMGSRATGLRYVDGQCARVGYLSGLRLEAEYRGRGSLLARGYRFLRELHDDRRVAFYLTTIAEDNDAALKLLGSGRAGLPVYRDCGRFSTFVLSNSRRNIKGRDRAIVVRQARSKDRDAILRFLNEYGPTRQFFPAYQASDLFSGAGRLKGLDPEDLALALRGDEIVGTLGSWDQRSFRQTVVHSYRGWLGRLRPLYNAWAAIDHQPHLPAAGAVVDSCSAAVPVVRDNSPEIIRALLKFILSRLTAQKSSMLLVGLHERDPLLPTIQRYASREYVTRMYLVYWRDDVPAVEQLIERIPYLELGCL